MTDLTEAYATVVARNPGENEFHQAVQEVFDSLGPVLNVSPPVHRDVRVGTTVRTRTSNYLSGPLGR